MPRYAIDIVILPPETEMDLAIALNQQLSGLREQSIHLNKTDTLPHISLFMGCLAADKLAEASVMLEQITQWQAPITLTLTGLKLAGNSPPVVALDIALSRELLEFQRRLVDAFLPLVTQDTAAEDLLDPTVSASTLAWINRFVPDQCGDRFWPHITAGHGTLTGNVVPRTFRATRIAVCHLGNHCTCRNILYEATLLR